MAPALFGDIKKKEDPRATSTLQTVDPSGIYARPRDEIAPPLPFPSLCCACIIHITTTPTILLYFCRRRDGYLAPLPLWIFSSGHPRHAAMSAWADRVWLGSSLKCSWIPVSHSLSLWRDAQGCRGCLMVLRERRSGLGGEVRF